MGFDKPELIMDHHKYVRKKHYFGNKYELIIYKGKWISSILVEDNCNKCGTMLGYYSKTGLKRINRSEVLCDDCK